jgi:ribosomal protein L11 methyltransferase
MSWRVSIRSTREQADRLPHNDELFEDFPEPPVLVADEPDQSRPDEWVIHAYFEHSPSADELNRLSSIGLGDPRIEELGEADWVTMSQAGLQPIRAGRFYVHTPMYRNVPPGAVPFEIDASLAFGTGQHATTSGCLEALDALDRNAHRFENIADIGTGTGLLAFAALSLWPDARCIATDIDPVALAVARDNALINGVKVGDRSGELLLVEADGANSALVRARAPFDLVIANILAGPLIEHAPELAPLVDERGTVILAGLLDSQAEAVARCYEAFGLKLVERSAGEWPVLVCARPGEL